MEGMGLTFTPVVVRHLLGPLSMFGIWLVPLGLIASPNSPYGGLTHLQLLTLAHPTPSYPFIHATHDITVVVKKLLKIQQFSVTTRKPQWFQYSKLRLLEIPNVTSWVGFPKSGHIAIISSDNPHLFIILHCQILFSKGSGKYRMNAV